MTDTNESSGVNLKKDVKFSIIIPAHNEEKYIRKCLDSIAKASEAYKEQTEVIVVLNRCTDQTEEIAKSYHCITLKNNDKNLSKIRNTGVKIHAHQLNILKYPPNEKIALLKVNIELEYKLSRNNN
ncbi:hypothetical protein B2J90_17170 [Bacillus tropicus]|nr:hypothetical protein B2J90_17170 [Bacillus cereus]